MLRLERIQISPQQWHALLEEFPERTLFQTPEWLAFLQDTQRGELVTAAVYDGSNVVGYFAGMVVQKFGFRILGSPFPGWTTAYMGCNLRPGVDRRAAVDALTRFAWQDLNCIHLEFMDRELRDADLPGFEHRVYSGFEVDLTPAEDQVFGTMDSACRRCVRKAAKSGVVIEEASDPDFADDYYAQMQDVFAKQRLVPTYAIERVRALIRRLQPAGRLLLLRARDADGHSIATGIFPGYHDTMYFWGGASWRPFQILRPNELLMWEAMKRWKARGITRFDMSGSGEYKRKYGGHEIAVPWFRISRSGIVPHLRATALRLTQLQQRLRGRWRYKPVAHKSMSEDAVGTGVQA